MICEFEFGLFYGVEVWVIVVGQQCCIGVFVQDCIQNNGVWLFEYYLCVVEVICDFVVYLVLIVMFIDMFGVDFGEVVNCNNQVYFIFWLIVEMVQIYVLVVGVIFGNGYLGGVILLVMVNVLFFVFDGVFNMIQLCGFVNIVCKYNLLWQECVQVVGVLVYEFFEQGYFDGVIDYMFDWFDEGIENFEKVIIFLIVVVEEFVLCFVCDQLVVFEYYCCMVSCFFDFLEWF